MLYRILADGVVLIHAAFVVFVVLGGFLAWHRRGIVWLHVPCVVWGVFVEYAGRVCPLTPLENALRARAGLQGYAGGFVEHYVIPALYPSALTRSWQLALGTLALAVNLLAYGVLVRMVLKSR